MKKGFFYGNTPEIFRWIGLIGHNLFMVGILMTKGYGFIDIKMSAVSYFFVKLFLGYLMVFKFLRSRYEKSYGEFKSVYDEDVVFQMPYMQFLYCINEYATSALMMSLFWMFVSGAS